MIQCWNLSYSVWKDMQTFLTTKSMGQVYYIQDTNVSGYQILLVDLNDPDKYLFKHTLSARGLGSSDTNVTDFETNYKTGATQVPNADDAVAKAVIAKG